MTQWRVGRTNALLDAHVPNDMDEWLRRLGRERRRKIGIAQVIDLHCPTHVVVGGAVTFTNGRCGLTRNGQPVAGMEWEWNNLANARRR